MGGTRFPTVYGIISAMLPGLGARPTLPSAAAGEGQSQLSYSHDAMTTCSRWPWLSSEEQEEYLFLPYLMTDHGLALPLSCIQGQLICTTLW